MERNEREFKGGRPVRRTSRKNVCSFCVDKAEAIDYKDVSKLRKYIT